MKLTRLLTELHQHEASIEQILKEIYLKEASIEQLQTQFVDSGKIEQKVFDNIKDVSEKSVEATWLIKQILNKNIQSEDIYKYKDYLSIFRRHKSKYPSSDINSYGNKIPISNFIKTTVGIRDSIKLDPSKDKGISKVDKYIKLKIGNVGGFNVYKIPKGSTNLKQVSCDLGSGTDWCTAHSEADEFEDHIEKGPLYIFIKGKEKYQFHYESNQFMDKNDIPLL